ncbi:cobyrinate a,c-diamide synthase [Actinocatenispora rupis]|uniref:Hydrogenobyrinate a,c-diamide synthase n=1 Tax=Actinocatenispora rupis TaxID=519421 RepID=A0A8J3JAT5_9ACTN|nr:cobyrinate a,c-diamide synthase [Actinocatenispora rupis]GID11358.1 hydrogenobyrinate a,c-diamide synthase [Actinocatenispora rupis]
MTGTPRLVVAAPSSGHGKTAVAVGLIAALAARGLTIGGFKIGPDYVDAGYLGLASGRAGRNLDPRLVGGGTLPGLFLHGAAGADVSVVEGTMGLFDGLSGRSDEENTAQVAGMLRAPVVLVVDAAAMGQSVAALVHGFRAYDELLWLGGVVLTRVSSDRHEQILRAALEEIGVPVLGALRRNDLSPLPPRQHGLVPVVDRAVDAVRAVRRLGERMMDRLDLDRILALARSAPPLTADRWSPEQAVGGRSDAPTSPAPSDATGYATESLPGEPPVVALAGAGEYAYSYPETAELLTAAGARVVTFDPLRDERLPEGTRAMVVGGGFPEAFADELSANRILRDEVVALARANGPIYAENAGLLWLVKDLDGREMCGVFDASAQTTNMLVLGYREATARASSSTVKVGSRVLGHKHHRTMVSPRAGDNAAWQWQGGRPEGFIWRRVHASFLNVHWAGYPEMASRFVAAIG